MNHDDPRHGSTAGHNAGCRCVPCGAAKLRYDKRRKYELHATGQRRTVPTYRAARRIHALQALGWSVPMIAAEANLPVKSLYDITLERGDRCWRRHFDPLVAAYERLSGQVPQGRYVGRTRRYAAARGWAPPLAWDDIDDPAEQPAGWEYLPPSRREQLAELDDLGYSVSEVCRRLHLSEDALQKWCGNHGLSDVYRRLAAREHRAPNGYSKEQAA